MKSPMPLKKQDLIDWVNERACTVYRSIEELGDCVGYVMILDALHPKLVAVRKLKCRSSLI